MPGTTFFEVPYQVALALTLASNATGADFDYLMKTAARESNFKPAAAARASSAVGLFQFIEETWLRTVKEDGAKYGLEHLSSKIFRTRSGRYYVPQEKHKRKILGLRNDPKISALMAGAYTQRNADIVAKGIGRRASRGELYLAHFLGPADAVRLIRLSRNNPKARADREFVRAARANRGIFFDGRRPRTVREVYRKLVKKHDPSDRTAQSSWTTHVVRVDATAARKARGHVAPLKNVPQPARKSAPAIQIAAPKPNLDPIAELLRGSLALSQKRTEQILARSTPVNN